MSADRRPGPSPAAQPIDWEAARARLAARAAAPERALGLKPKEIEAVLRARARVLAAPRISDASDGGSTEIVTFAAAGARYGIDGAYVSGVGRLGLLARVPDVPPFIAGVTNHAGEIVMVVDLSQLLGLAATPTPPGALLLELAARDLDPIAIIADSVHERTAFAAGDLHPVVAGEGPGRELRRALTTDGCLIIDGRALLGDPRLRPHRPHST